MANADLSAAIKAAIASVEIPGGGTLSEYRGLSEVIVTQSAVAFAISVQPGMEAAFGPARAEAERRALAVAEGRKVMASITADRTGGPATGQAKAQGRPGPPPRTPVPGVRNIIAVGSGKGGVGKSTVAANVALSFAAEGLRTGLLDADLYGPSVPRLLGIEGRPAVREDGIFAPHEAYGLKVISIGSMLTPDQAVVWRGPMATSALRQLLRETAWGDLDVLVVDLPPGTGDIHISLVQQVDLTGVIIVSTPQDLALIDAKKAIDMLRRTGVPILGLIENMSYFVAPDTGARYDIFGHGGAAAAAERLGLPFLGEIPLVMSIRDTSDTGRPVVATAPGGPEAESFRSIVRQLLSRTPTLRP